MTDNKNLNTEQRVSLKEADMEKSGTESLGNVADEPEVALAGKRMRDEHSIQKKKKKGRVPLALDIFLAILVIALAVALVVGVYSIFKYYTLGYKEVTLEYALVSDDENMDESVILPLLKGEDLYLDVEGNTLYLGEIESIGRNSSGQVVITATVDVKYKNGEGYSVEDRRIATGSDYMLRIGELCFEATVVELRELGGNQ